jgi:hypothetical protein
LNAKVPTTTPTALLAAVRKGKAKAVPYIFILLEIT